MPSTMASLEVALAVAIAATSADVRTSALARSCEGRAGVTSPREWRPRLESDSMLETVLERPIGEADTRHRPR